MAEPVLLRRALFNLLQNALRYTERGGVMVALRVRQKYLRIEVWDTGIGIAQEDIPRALERFGQIDSALSRKHDGTGLGLPLAKELMEMHGGTLVLTSEVGVGTVAFTLGIGPLVQHFLPRLRMRDQYR